MVTYKDLTGIHTVEDLSEHPAAKDLPAPVNTARSQPVVDDMLLYQDNDTCTFQEYEVMKCLKKACEPYGWDVQEVLQARKIKGFKKYQKFLCTFDGRPPSLDEVQEEIDRCIYKWKELMEKR